MPELGHSNGRLAAPERPFRLPPHDLQAEQGVLGSILLDGSVLHEIAQTLRSEDFYRAAHQTMYRAMLAIYERSGAVDAITLADELTLLGEYERIGGDRLLGEVQDATPHAANARYYAQIVRQKSIARGLIEAANRILEDGYSGLVPAPDLLEQAEQAVFRLAEEAAVGQTVPLSFAVVEADRRIDAREAGRFSGITTGILPLDDLTDGFQDEQFIILAARPSMGKAQPLDAKVLTPGGFIPMGDLAVGDMVIGSDGTPVRVLGVYPQGSRPVYQVTMTDGGSTECCEEHLWFTQTRNERRAGCSGSVKSLAEIGRTLSRVDSDSPNHAIPKVAPVMFVERPWPRLYPHAMGLLLGDGSFRSVSIRFSNPEQDLCHRLAEMLPPGDEFVPGSDGLSHAIRKSRHGHNLSATSAILRDYGLNGGGSRDKFIPEDYLFGSPETRLSLLRGLLDTDGYVTDGGRSVELCTSSPRLAADVAFLVRSLGGVISTRVRVPTYIHRGETRRGAESSRMVIQLPDGMVPVSSEKHLSRWKGGPTRYRRSIASIEPVGEKPCQCIRVDAPDHLYVTDDFIVTHNTAIALNICRHVALEGRRGVLLVSLEMSRSEIGERLIASTAEIDGYRLKKPRCLTDDERGARARANLLLSDAPCWIDDTPVRTIGQIAANARRARLRHGVRLVIVDYLQLISGAGERGASRQEQVAEISRRLKELARELKSPVLALSQLNRASESRQDKRPRMGDLRESGALEQDADLVLLLHRPEYYDAADRPGIAELIVAKNRNGDTGTVELAFRKAVGRFEMLCPFEGPGPAGG